MSARLDTLGFSQRDFSELVDESEGNISRIISGWGNYRPQMEKGPRWADALKLEGDERVRFLEALAFAACPVEAQRIVRDLREEFVLLSNAARRCEQRLADLLD
jgi:hypothetical protein